MKARGFVHRGTGRFSKILSAESDRALFDTVLARGDDWVVAPTLGAIVPGWLLLIPKKESLNFKDWSAISKKTPSELVEEVCCNIGLEKSEVIWFEHGPALDGSLVGCGVDYAHIHILINPPFSFDQFAKSASQDAGLKWTASQPEGVYGGLSDHVSYVLACNDKKALFAENVEEIGSQFFRRVIAKLAGVSHEWNYREFPHIANVQATIDLIDQRT